MQTTEKTKYKIKSWDDLTNTFVVEVVDGVFNGLEVSITKIIEGEEEGTLDVDYDVVKSPEGVEVNNEILTSLLTAIINDALEFVYRETQEKIEVNVENTSEHRTDNTKQSDNE